MFSNFFCAFSSTVDWKQQIFWQSNPMLQIKIIVFQFRFIVVLPNASGFSSALCVRTQVPLTRSFFLRKDHHQSFIITCEKKNFRKPRNWEIEFLSQVREKSFFFFLFPEDFLGWVRFCTWIVIRKEIVREIENDEKIKKIKNCFSLTWQEDLFPACRIL